MAGEIGIFLAVVALIGWGAYPVLMKKVIDKLGEYTCLLFNSVVIVVFLIITSVFTIKIQMPSDFVIAAIVIGSIMGVIALYLYYKAIRLGNVSVVTVIVSMYAIWTVIVSYFLFNERLLVQQYIAIGVIIIGSIIVAMEKLSLPERFNEKHFKQFMKSDVWSEGAGLALVVSFCWTVYNLAVKYSVKSIGPHKTMVYMVTLGLFFILLAFLARPVKELVTMPDKKQLKWLGPSALLYSIGAVSFFFALKYSPLSIVTPITSAAPAVTVVMAVAILGDRLKAHQYVGILMAVAGIVVLSL